MAERMRYLKEALVRIGYKCTSSRRRDMTAYFVTRAQNGIKFGIGARNGNIYIVRFSEIDHPKNGTETIASPNSNAENIALFVELLARCAMLRTA